MNLDLDAFMQAREETLGEQTITLGGQKFPLPRQPSYSWTETFDEALARGEIKTCIDMLLGDNAAKFWELDPPLAAVHELIREAPLLITGLSVGEAEASSSTSGRTSKNSRQRSKPATASTSPKPSGAVKRSA